MLSNMLDSQSLVPWLKLIATQQEVCVMTKKSPNHGEGDPQAAERFNAAERAFVDSARGKKKIKEGRFPIGLGPWV